jgi:hypothetical protein
MQDAESTDLLSTAVSSARIKEFADASRARNVVIVLDCCYAGAFRGGDLGDAVAGPGRYVLTSCRGTQLANDATVENGTSFSPSTWLRPRPGRRRPGRGWLRHLLRSLRLRGSAD